MCKKARKESASKSASSKPERENSAYGEFASAEKPDRLSYNADLTYSGYSADNKSENKDSLRRDMEVCARFQGENQ